jgi:hypothetical protein
MCTRVYVGPVAAEHITQLFSEEVSGQQDNVPAPIYGRIIEKVINVNDNLLDPHQIKICKFTPKDKERLKTTDVKKRNTPLRVIDLHKNDPNVMLLDSSMREEILGQIDAMANKGLQYVVILFFFFFFLSSFSFNFVRTFAIAFQDILKTDLKHISQAVQKTVTRVKLDYDSKEIGSFINYNFIYKSQFQKTYFFLLLSIFSEH